MFDKHATVLPAACVQNGRMRFPLVVEFTLPRFARTSSKGITGGVESFDLLSRVIEITGGRQTRAKFEFIDYDAVYKIIYFYLAQERMHWC